MFRRVRTSISTVIDTVANRLHMPKSAAIGLLGASAVLAPLGAYAYFATNTASLETQIFIGDEEECRNYVKEAVDAQGGESSHEQGAVKIPDVTSGTYRTGYMGSWEWTVNDARGNSNFSDICKFYDANGGHLDSTGFERIGDYYIVAVMWSPFGAKTGDHITFYFDDGTRIETIVGDEKGCQPKFKQPEHYNDAPELDPNGTASLYSNGWGHIDKSDSPKDCQVLEFWGNGSGDSYTKLRASTDGNFKRVVGATNHGTVSGFVDGVVNAADSNSTTTKRASQKGAVNECRAKTPYDNSTLAKAAVSFAWSSNDGGYNVRPTSLYQEVVDATVANPAYGATHEPDGRCCYCMVRAAFMWTGADINFPQADYESADRYFSMHPELYQRVEGAQDVKLDGSREWADEHGLLPGDFAITTPESSKEYCAKVKGLGYVPNSGHVVMYVSHEIAQETYDSFVQGRIDDGDTGVRPTTEYVQASYQSWAATCVDYTDNGIRRYNFWRYIGGYPDKSEFSDVGISANLQYTPVSGTSCECEKECEESIGEELAYLAVQCAAWYDKGNGWNTDGVFSPKGETGANPWYNPYTSDHSSTGTWSDAMPEPWTQAVSVDAGIYKETTEEEIELMRNESKVFNEVALHGDSSFNAALGSCNQAVCGLTAAVVDMDMTPHRAASGNPGFMKYYLEQHPQYWRRISTTSVSDLKPGDVLVVANLTVDVSTGDDGIPNFDEGGETGWNGCHTALFVGKDLAAQRFPEIKSWSAEGVVYQAGYSHDHGRYPGLNPIDDISAYTVFRPIKRNENSQFEDVDYKACLPSWNLKSSCPDEEDVNHTGYDAVVAKAMEFLGRPYIRGGGRWNAADKRDPNLYGADCSGLVIWAYYQALGIDIPAQGGGNGTHQFEDCRSGYCWEEVSYEEMVPGDIMVCVCDIPSDAMHTIMYCGKNAAGEDYFIEEAGKEGVPGGCHLLSAEAAKRWSKDPSRLYFLHYKGLS